MNFQISRIMERDQNNKKVKYEFDRVNHKKMLITK